MEHFLSTWKRTCCTEAGWHKGTCGSGKFLVFVFCYGVVRENWEDAAHDWTQCNGFHTKGSDRRRNPYVNVYLPDEKGVSAIEKAYHPSIFRTQFCREKRCKYGTYCAFARSLEELWAGDTYEEMMKENQGLTTSV